MGEETDDLGQGADGKELAGLRRLQGRRRREGQWEVQPRAETVTALRQQEVARRAVMEETRAKRDCSRSPNTEPDSARGKYDHRHDE